MARNIAGVIAGLIVGVIVLALVAMLGGALFPVKAQVNMQNPGEVKALFAGLPLQLKLVILFAWFAAALAGGLVAKWVTGLGWPVWTVAILFALYVAMSISVLPMPGWMQALSLAVPILGGLLAHHFGPSRRVAAVSHDAALDDIET